MKKVLAIFLLVAGSPGLCSAQVMGNVGFGQAGDTKRPEQSERASRELASGEIPPTATSQFVDANVLMNVKADEYVAVFGVTQEGRDLVECGQKLDARIKTFSSSLQQLGIAPNDTFVDFIAQTRIYEFEVTNDVAKEKLAGFEVKKNVSIHYRDKTLLERMVLAAAGVEIFDLIKVDYLVKDAPAVQKRLMEEAARVIKEKTARYERLLGLRVRPPLQVYAEKFNVYYPVELYDSYVAQEAENVNAGYFRQKYVIQGARKSRTFYFDPLSARSFDVVVNSTVLEPVVQFTLYLKVKYEIDAVKKPARVVRVKPGRAGGAAAHARR